MSENIVNSLREFFISRDNLRFFVMVGIVFVIASLLVNTTGNDQLEEDSMRDFANDTDELVETYDDMLSDIESDSEDLIDGLPEDAFADDASALQNYLIEALQDDLGDYVNRIALVLPDGTSAILGNSPDQDNTWVLASQLSESDLPANMIQEVRANQEESWQVDADGNLLYGLAFEYAPANSDESDTPSVLLATVPSQTLASLLPEAADSEGFYASTEAGYAFLLNAENEIIASYGRLSDTSNQESLDNLLMQISEASLNDHDVYRLDAQAFMEEESIVAAQAIDLDGWQIVGSIPSSDFPQVGIIDSTEDIFGFTELGGLISNYVEDGVDFLNTELSWIFRGIRYPIERVITIIEDALLAAPWQLVILATLSIAWVVSGRRTAYIAAFGMFGIGLLGLWDRTMTTTAMLLTSMAFCMVVGLPLGILSARSERLNGIVRSILDAMQTIHPFVYLVPIVVLFGIGKVPGTIATIIFALPPMVRLTNLGIRQVPEDVVEAALAFGSNDWQLLRDVQIPLALPSIMAGVNQTLMLSLSMVVIVALIAGGGLGEEIYRSIGRADTGRAVVAGIAVLLLAVVVDRVSQGKTGKKRTAE